MGTLTLKLPDSLHERIRLLAKKEGISINQFIVSAAAEKAASLMTEDDFKERAKMADRNKFQAVLDKVPDVEPEAYDRL